MFALMGVVKHQCSLIIKFGKCVISFSIVLNGPPIANSQFRPTLVLCGRGLSIRYYTDHIHNLCPFVITFNTYTVGISIFQCLHVCITFGPHFALDSVQRFTSKRFLLQGVVLRTALHQPKLGRCAIVVCWWDLEGGIINTQYDFHLNRELL